MIKMLKYAFHVIRYFAIAAWYSVKGGTPGEKGFRQSADAVSLSMKGTIEVNWEDCIGCRECERVCPVRCIFINTKTSFERDDLGITSDGRKKTEWVLEFDVDMSKCLFCELCIAPCPTGCITMSDERIEPVRHRETLDYHFTPFTPERAFLMSKGISEPRIG